MTNEKEGAAAGTANAQETIPALNDNTPELVGQLFKIVARINMTFPKEHICVFASYLDRKVSVTVVYFGNQFVFSMDKEANPAVLEAIICALEFVEEVLTWNARF